MTNSQRLTLQVSEARQGLNALIEARNKLPADKEPDAESIRRMDEGPGECKRWKPNTVLPSSLKPEKKNIGTKPLPILKRSRDGGC